MIPRVYISHPLEAGQTVVVDTQAHNYLVRVLRLRVGAGVVLFDGRGQDWPGQLTSVTPQATVVLGAMPSTPATESPLRVTLVQGVPKGERMEWIIQKWVELGGDRLIPLLTQRGVVQLPPERRQDRQQRWQRIAIEAAEQCGRSRVPVVEQPVTWSDLAACLVDDGSRLLLQERMATPTTLNQIRPQSAVTVLVGPEGGLTAEEQRMACDSMGFVPVSLGRRVLRTETAALAAMAAVQLLWGDMA
ncbi:MAG: 16S rRNA (uracil(1498)-N(3))-methyltransferase [Magnetococcales bacterium]|nr:16S rRNA (uracil(1498)-N(3))-methyltransferase [Magnetococcales bacterium]